MKRKKAVYKNEKASFPLDILNEESGVVSVTECTGLMPTPPRSEAEEDSYNEIYVIPKAQTAGECPKKGAQ